MRDKRFCADEGLFADDSSVQNDGAHADKNLVTDFAGMDDRAVAHGDPITHNAWEIIRDVQHSVVLNIRVMADGDAVDVAAQDASVPNARVRAESHIADDGSGFGDENAPAELRGLAEESVELRVHLHLPQVNAIHPIVKIFDSICRPDGA